MKVTELTVRSALELAATIEDKAAERYETLARKYADDAALSEVFSQLAKDEAAHGSHFSELIERTPEEGGLEDREEALNLLRASVASKVLSPEGLAQADDIQTPADALRSALDLEKATLFFYQSLKDVLDDNAEVDHLIETEKRHVSALMKVLVSDARFRGLDDNW